MNHRHVERDEKTIDGISGFRTNDGRVRATAIRTGARVIDRKAAKNIAKVFV